MIHTARYKFFYLITYLLTDRPTYSLTLLSHSLTYLLNKSQIKQHVNIHKGVIIQLIWSQWFRDREWWNSWSAKVFSTIPVLHDSGIFGLPGIPALVKVWSNFRNLYQCHESRNPWSSYQYYGIPVVRLRTLWSRDFQGWLKFIRNLFSISGMLGFVLPL